MTVKHMGFRPSSWWVGCVALLAAGAASAQEVDPPGRVARVNIIEGQASVQLAGDTSWTPDVLNRPLTTGDKVWVDTSSRAEMSAGSTVFRLGAQTGVEWLNLGDQVLQLRFTAGSLSIRVRALQPNESVEIDTPNVSVALLQPGEYRLDVNDSGDDTQVAVISGQASVTGSNDTWRLDPRERGDFNGANDIRADVGDLIGPDALDLWAEQRDARAERSVSAQYVSSDVPGYQDLDDYGSWEDDPMYGPLWAPRVVMGWAPYHFGHWVWVSPWGWTWMDNEPWGFAPFHYGRWVYARSRWCWSPGRVVARPVYAPALVAWVGGAGFSASLSVGGGGVAWFPLGYNEVYRPAYRVSNTYIRNVNVTNTYINNTTIINNTTTIINNGRPEREPHYVNQRVPGAVAAVSRDAFVTARPVRPNMLPLNQRAVAMATASTAAIAIAPTLRSQARMHHDEGRPARTVAPAPAVFERPIVTRRVPLPAAPSFEAQRRAVIANGSRPVPVSQASSSRIDGNPRTYGNVPVRIVRPAMSEQGPRERSQMPAQGRQTMPLQNAPGARVPGPAPRADRPPEVQRPMDRRVMPAPEQRAPAERIPVDRRPVERGAIERAPVERNPVERGPVERSAVEPMRTDRPAIIEPRAGAGPGSSDARFREQQELYRQRALERQQQLQQQQQQMQQQQRQMQERSEQQRPVIQRQEQRAPVERVEQQRAEQPRPVQPRMPEMRHEREQRPDRR